MLNRAPEELARDLRLYAALMLFRLGRLSPAPLVHPDLRSGAGELELDMGRLLRPDTFDPRGCAWAVPVAVSEDVVAALLPPMRAKRVGLLRGVRPLVDALIAQGFHLDPDLHQMALDLAGE